MLRPVSRAHALASLVLFTGCGGAAEPPVAEAPHEPVAAEPAPPDASAYCARIEWDGEEPDSCVLREERATLADGRTAGVLQIHTFDEQGGENTYLFVVFGLDAEAPAVVELAGARDDGNGGEWSELTFGALAADGDRVVATYTVTDVIRGCTGDPSCFDDDSNLERTPFERRRVCGMEYDEYECADADE